MEDTTNLIKDLNELNDNFLGEHSRIATKRPNYRDRKLTDVIIETDGQGHKEAMKRSTALLEFRSLQDLRARSSPPVRSMSRHRSQERQMQGLRALLKDDLQQGELQAPEGLFQMRRRSHESRLRPAKASQVQRVSAPRTNDQRQGHQRPHRSQDARQGLPDEADRRGLAETITDYT